MSDRLTIAGELLRERTEVEPDFYFARRVVARLPGPAGPAEVLGWAALRALPGALALAAILAGIGLVQIPPAASLLAGDSSPDVLLTYSTLVDGTP